MWPANRASTMVVVRGLVRSTPFAARWTPARPLSASLSTASSEPNKQPLPAHYKYSISWAEYFEIRRKRIRHERLTLVPTTLGGFLGGIAYFGTRPFDTSVMFGIDMPTWYGIGAAMCGIGGFLVGPLVASTTWRMANRQLSETLDKMDREFYEHIVKNRSDPTLSTVDNPVPDYYGEYIRSIRQYRAWLRKQQEHRRKGTFQLGEDIE